MVDIEYLSLGRVEGTGSTVGRLRRSLYIRGPVS